MNTPLLRGRSVGRLLLARGGRAGGGAKLDSIRALTAMPGGWNFVFPPAVVVAANTSDATGRELEVRHSLLARSRAAS